ncbi:gliding motility-associated C-terminal domain-containing protein [Limibacter armeniacum]|uniref:T9SS type B sorting domain-containing protein n=1 Tax=Limibacter armeniacum TaxID=466084 RepID=UPI002FE5A485
MRNIINVFLITATLICFASLNLYASHIRAGDLTIKRSSNTSSLTYEITVILYRDVGGVPAGKGLIDFGDGTEAKQVEPISLGLTQDKMTEMLQYTTTHTFASAGSYKVSYFEMQRNSNIKNMDNSDAMSFYVESEFLINPILGLNSSPILTIPPVLHASIGQKYIINAGAYDAQGDSLSYRLTICLQNKNKPVNNYRFPDDLNETWTFEREDCTIPGDFYIDEITGDLVWDSPNEIGEYNVAFFVDEWRDGVLIGSVNRDMQIIVNDNINLRPLLTLPKDTCIVAGEVLTGMIIGEDQQERVCASGGKQPSLDSVSLHLAAFPVLSLPSQQPTFQIFNTPPVHKQEGTLSWQTTCNDVRNQPYQFTFQALDHPKPSNLQLGDTQTWRVRVLGPAPQGLTAETDTLNGTVRLNWDAYSCGRAEKIHIYRKVGSFDFQPVCETGLPEYTGYQKVGEVDINATSFEDVTVQGGSNYCYRIYASFSQPQGGESLASQEACTFVPALFYMTNVSIDQTDSEDGEISVAWTQPYNESLESVTYRLFRGEGLSGMDPLTEINQTFQKQDTSYIDKGLDTENTRYHYWVELSSSGNLLETSRTASQVELRASPKLNSIILNWKASVPWSITSSSRPIHYIFKKLKEEDNSEFKLLDSVMVSSEGLMYEDLSEGMIEGQEYCYKILTVGTYEQYGLPDSLINYSQELCATLLDTIPPCPPVLTLVSPDCNALSQEQYSTDDQCLQTYTNQLSWIDGTGDTCDDDIAYYNIYYSEREQSSLEGFNKIGSTPDLQYLHEDLVSIAGSYTVTAVDFSGNESVLSNIEVQDNECTSYILPNAFSPNNDGINDLFIPMRCPRFVKEVKFTVINRWGGLIFTSDQNPEINWDGRDLDGQLLSSGTYYYEAEVTFYRLHEEDEKTTYKGWVMLMRNKDDNNIDTSIK